MIEHNYHADIHVPTHPHPGIAHKPIPAMHIARKMGQQQDDLDDNDVDDYDNDFYF